MNKQVIQIAVDSGFKFERLTAANKTNLEVNLDCFSRGIVKSCVANLRSHGYDDAAEQLAKHFGVE